MVDREPRGADPVRILLARHGETEWNVERRWQGHADAALTEQGIEQARRLGRALATEPITAVYASDLGRAMATARYVAEPHGLEPTPEPRLREIDTGLWTGRRRVELVDQYRAEMQVWSLRPAEHRMPGGESLADVQARCLAFFAERMAGHAPGACVAVITHGVATQSILIHALGGTVADLWMERRVDNCQISRLEWTAAGGLRVVELSDVRHLAGLGPVDD